jgi:cytoskeletal protein CcmA (bactofilin family)
MNHFDEMTCLLYLEGQLDAARARELGAHAGECPACRDLLHALEHESQLLAGALTEEDESIPARLLVTQSWSFPSWVWTFAFGIFTAGAYWLWTDGISPWIDQLNSAGFGGTSLFSMILFSGAFWEGWSGMMDAMEISFLILLAIAVLVLIRKRLRRSMTIAVVMSALLFAVALPQQAAGADVRRGRSVFVPAGETVHNDLIATGPSVRIDGTVEGDLIVFTRNLTVTGHVTGDVIAFAAQVLIDGTVDGNVRAMSHGVILQGSVGKNSSFIANSIDLSPKADIGGEMIAMAAEANLDGKIHRDLLGIIGTSNLEGLIGGQASIRGQSLTVGSAAQIQGPATFVGREQPVVAPGAQLASPIQTQITQGFRRSRRSAVRPVVRQVFSFAAALVVGILLVVIVPGFFRTTLRETGSIGLPIGIGALALIMGGFLAVIGVLLLFIGVGAGVAGVLAYAPVLYVAQVFVGAWLGNKIMPETSHLISAIVGRMALGLLLLHVVGLIPVLGGLMWFAVLLWGTGAVLLGFYRMSNAENVAALPA